MRNRITLFAAVVVLLLTGCADSEEPQGSQQQAEAADVSAQAPQASPGPDIHGPVSPANIPAGIYAVDKSYTYLTFSYSHLGYSFPRLRVTGIDGELNLNGDDMAQSSVAITIDADTIDSQMERFDTELKSLQYFNVQDYPYITYTSSSYEPATETTGILQGYLTIKGNTRPVALDVVINNATFNPVIDKPIIGISATSSLKRTDFGLSRNVPFVGDNVNIEIHMEFAQGHSDTSAAAARIAENTTAAAAPESLILTEQVAGNSAALESSSVPGEYSISFRLPNGDNESILTLNTDGTGTMTTPSGLSHLNSIRYNGDDFSFTLALNTPLGEMELEYEGTVEGDEIVNGRLNTPMGLQPFSGSRIK